MTRRSLDSRWFADEDDAVNTPPLSIPRDLVLFVTGGIVALIFAVAPISYGKFAAGGIVCALVVASVTSQRQRRRQARLRFAQATLSGQLVLLPPHPPKQAYRRRNLRAHTHRSQKSRRVENDLIVEGNTSCAVFTAPVEWRSDALVEAAGRFQTCAQAAGVAAAKHVLLAREERELLFFRDSSATRIHATTQRLGLRPAGDEVLQAIATPLPKYPARNDYDVIQLVEDGPWFAALELPLGRGDYRSAARRAVQAVVLGGCAALVVQTDLLRTPHLAVYARVDADEAADAADRRHAVALQLALRGVEATPVTDPQLLAVLGDDGRVPT